MTASPGLHRLVLTAHITTSVGWLGAVAAYLALDIIATAGQDVVSVRAAYFGMEALILYVIVPFALISVLVGIVNALSAPWGLFQHYWVVVKLLLTLFAITILLLEVPASDTRPGWRHPVPIPARHRGHCRTLSAASSFYSLSPSCPCTSRAA